MKILQVAERFYPCIGGIEKYVEDLSLHLIKRGHTVDVCCLNRCAHSNSKLPDKDLYKGITIYRIPYLKIKDRRDLPYRVAHPRKILKLAKNYDILHVHGINFFLDFLSSTKRMHKRPLILSTHGGIFHTEKFSLLKKPFFHMWSKNKLKNFDRILADSRNDEKIFSRISKNVALMPLGTDLDRYSEIKRKPQNRTLVFIGRMSTNKRIDRLIETVSELKKLRKVYRLYVAGPDWTGEQKRLKALAKAKNVDKNVKFMGEITEKKKLNLLSKAEFFVSASQYEGFGISVIEAIAAGVPVILNDIESFTDFVEDGKNGFIVDFNKPEEVAIKIEKIEKQDLARISEEARRVAKKYDWNTLTGKIEDVYRRCLHENR